MEKRRYADFFTVPQDYKPNMTREVINETPDTWLDFYPHIKYEEFLNTLISAVNGGSKSIWLTGNYGTGKSNAALVTLKLFMDDEVRVRRWFAACENILTDSTALLSNLLARRSEGTLVVYDYDASGVGPNEDFLVRLERGIVTALNDGGFVVPAKANLDEIIGRLQREDKHFFAIRDNMQSELIHLNANITTIEQLVSELRKVHQNDKVPTKLLGDVQRVFHRDNIYLDISVPTFRKWIHEIISVNKLKRIVYLFDEFSEFIDANKETLKTFEDVAENPGINKLYFVPVTHRNIQSFFGEHSAGARKATDRFHFRNLQMPNDTAFQLAAHAMKPIPDPDNPEVPDSKMADEWKMEKNNLWEAVRGIAEVHFRPEDVSTQSFYNVLPIHPMAAFLLKFLAEAASNQRSIYVYLKGSADGREFQDFIRAGGPAIQSKQFLTADYLWKYFIERDDLGLNKEIIAIRSEFIQIKSRHFQNRDEDDEDIRVLKAVLLFCLLSRLMDAEPHERLKPTVENIKLAFQGDGAIVGVENIIKSLVEKHCFSVVNGNIELYASSVGNEDLLKKIEDFKPKFHELLSEKTGDALKSHKKSDLARFSMGRFDLRVSDVNHTTRTNITTAVREKYSAGLNNDTGTVCLWFVVAKNQEEQMQISEKINSLLMHLHDHRIMMFSFPNLTFCDSNIDLWNDYVEQFAKYGLENDTAAQTQSKLAYERLEKEWFDRIRNFNTLIKVYTVINGQVVISDTSWVKFKDILNDYVRRTLGGCIDYLTEQTTAFEQKAFQGWATAGIRFDSTSGEGKHKQLVTAFKNQGITADENWFSQNINHPIAQIRAFFDKKISNTIAKGTNLSIRRQYIELQRAPYGLKCNALSAFVLGIALRHILDKGYQWDNLQKTGVLDTDALAEIIETVVKDDGQDNIKGEKYICRLSRAEKAFVEKAPRMFGITNSMPDARVEDVLLQIQNKIEQISARVPLWILPEYIRSVDEPFEEVISKALNDICLAGSTSSKSGKSEERTNAIKDVGQFILDNPSLIDTVAGYIHTDNFLRAFHIYMDKTAPLFDVLAKEVGDETWGYCQTILDKAAETAGLLWKPSDISKEIDETMHEYEIIKLMKKILDFASFVPYKNIMDTLRNAVISTNKLPKTLIANAIPALAAFLTNIVNGGVISNIRDGLAQNSDIIKALFFDVSKQKSIELLKRHLTGLTIDDSDLLYIYNGLQSGFAQDEAVFLDNIRIKIESFIKESVAQNIKTEWKRITSADSPTTWASDNGIPARFALNGNSATNDIIVAVESPSSFSSDKLEEILEILKAISITSIVDCQEQFMKETVPQRFVKFNITLSSLLEFLKSKYGKQPNSWLPRPDLNDFIRSQYKGMFAPQVTEKIKKTSAEDLKNRLLQLAQENPDLGLLFWE